MKNGFMFRLKTDKGRVFLLERQVDEKLGHFRLFDASPFREPDFAIYTLDFDDLEVIE